MQKNKLSVNRGVYHGKDTDTLSVMEWRDEGIVLAARKHGESSSIVSLLTRDHGRHAGLVRGGSSKKKQAILQPGNRVDAVWRGRLSEHLGAYQCELVTPFAAPLLSDPLRLACLTAACAITEAAFPEREKHSDVFDGLNILLNALDGEVWPTVYVKWELGVLGELGFALDFSQCAATGSLEDLAYVSPKSGRSVSKEAAQPYRERMLVLPKFLLDSDTVGSFEEIADGLKLTGYFLGRHVFAHQERQLPPARLRFAERVRTASNSQS